MKVIRSIPAQAKYDLCTDHRVVHYQETKHDNTHHQSIRQGNNKAYARIVNNNCVGHTKKRQGNKTRNNGKDEEDKGREEC